MIFFTVQQIINNAPIGLKLHNFCSFKAENSIQNPSTNATHEHMWEKFELSSIDSYILIPSTHNQNDACDLVFFENQYLSANDWFQLGWKIHL